MFAPTNEAFDQLPGAGLDRIGEIIRKSPEDILRFHIIRTGLDSAYLWEADYFMTSAGARLFFDTLETQLIINTGITVLQPIIRADNGFIYKVDAVLLPPVPENILSANSINDSEVLNQLIVESLATDVSQSFTGENFIFSTASSNDLFFPGDYMSLFLSQVSQSAFLSGTPDSVTVFLDTSERFRVTHGLGNLVYIIFKNNAIKFVVAG